MSDDVFMILDARKRLFRKLGMFLRAFLSRMNPLRAQDICCSAESYTIVAPVSMVRVGGRHHSQRVHILVYGKIVPPHPGVTVQVSFQGHQIDIDSVDSGQTRPVTALTDRAGEFVVDENFICGPQVKFITSVTSIPGTDVFTVIASLRLKKEATSCCEKYASRLNKDPLPTATITIDFESHCQKSVTYWFENPYKDGNISRTTEIFYRPTESSALYLKLLPYKEDHTSIIDVFITTEECPVPRYQRFHTTRAEEEFIRIALFDPESTLKSALILV
ncbi:hypothetical protein H206_00976 [Candidatus Electrothrix aarhusensis]|uniref:Uncharacterized protein n=1 Tax=Candidatus Electrothrix aarhusensis TaxID=1859131 RepID=A0A444IWR8_9BACT|nr:hypothetical protein H206_00976 [Candidatus Electrothrix aarhusensis]